MANAPSFAATPKHAHGQVSAANTNRDGTGTLVTLLTAGASGSKIEEITVEATVTTTAGMVRLFISTDGGTTKRMWDEIVIDAVTPSASVAAFRKTKRYTNWLLPAGALVYASTHNAEAMNVHADYGDF